MIRHNERGANQRFATLLQRLIDQLDPPSINQMAHRTRLTHGVISKAVDGIQPSWATVNAIAREYPEHALALFEAAGYPVPVDLVPGVSEASERTGDSPSSVVEEAVRRMMDGLAV